MGSDREAVPHRGQTAAGAVQTSKATVIVGVKTRSSRRRPAPGNRSRGGNDGFRSEGGPAPGANRRRCGADEQGDGDRGGQNEVVQAQAGAREQVERRQRWVPSGEAMKGSRYLHYRAAAPTSRENLDADHH